MSRQVRGCIRLRFATIEKVYPSYNEFMSDLKNMGRMGYDIISYEYRLVPVIN